MSDLYRLVYASKNLLQGPEPEAMAAVRQILDASRRNNAALDVTGALMFNAGAFAQVLEGPRQGVEATFERIQRDRQALQEPPRRHARRHDRPGPVDHQEALPGRVEIGNQGVARRALPGRDREPRVPERRAGGQGIRAHARASRECRAARGGKTPPG
ncbi:BLUF domain-containing protein [Methylobacterium organophilum]|nr:BLUF domain-containing protein [Methylobacterium organophilum]